MVSAIGDEDVNSMGMKARSLAAIPYDFQPLPPLRLTKPIYSDSLGRAEEIEARGSSAPQLEPPLEHYLLAFIRDTKRMEGQNSEYAAFADFEIDRQFKELDAHNIEFQEIVRKKAAEMAASSNWGILATVAQYLASGASIVLGAACLSRGAEKAGWLLIASGMAGLSNQVMKDIALHEKMAALFTESNELQKTIANRIEMGMFFLSLGLGLAGGGAAYSAGILHQQAAANGIVGIKETLGQSIGTAGTVLGGTSRMGLAHTQKQIYDVNKRENQLNSLNTQNHHMIYQIGANAQHMIESTTDRTDTIKGLIAASDVVEAIH